MSDATASTPTASAETLKRRERQLLDMYAASDAWEAARLGEFLAADVAFRFGNAEPTQGLELIQAMMNGLQQVMASVSHDVQRIIHGHDDHATVEVAMHYVRNDGEELRVPAAVVFHFRADELIDQYRIYINTGDFFG